MGARRPAPRSAERPRRDTMERLQGRIAALEARVESLEAQLLGDHVCDRRIAQGGEGRRHSRRRIARSVA